MRAGKLDRTIRIDQFDPNGVNDFGTPGATWTPLASMRAEVLQASTQEFIRNGAEDENVVIFRTRYLAGVTTADRIHYDGDFFNVKEVKEIGRRNGLELRAIARGAS